MRKPVPSPFQAPSPVGSARKPRDRTPSWEPGTVGGRKFTRTPERDPAQPAFHRACPSRAPSWSSPTCRLPRKERRFGNSALGRAEPSA